MVPCGIDRSEVVCGEEPVKQGSQSRDGLQSKGETSCMPGANRGAGWRPEMSLVGMETGPIKPTCVDEDGRGEWTNESQWLDGGSIWGTVGSEAEEWAAGCPH